MASPANEGGKGGKFRRRPLRRTPATPYDRPPAALRGGGGGGLVRESGGWISRLVDPASRLIASGASRLFSSVFQKRLTAPPSVPEEDRQSKEEVSQLACANGDRDGDYCTNNSEIGGHGTRDVISHTNNSDNGGIVELEQLLKQKTFTRGEFDRLAELLRSRTVEPLKSGPDINHEREEKEYVLAQENGIGSSKVQENVSVAAGSLAIRNQIPIDEAASPAELAKAYIYSRPSKISSPAVNLQNKAFQGNTNSPSIPSASNLLDLSVAPRSVIRFSGIPERPELGRQNSRPLGRSAIYRMSRSPYFKVNPMKNVQVRELSRDGYAYPSSTQWTPRTTIQSGRKQVLKRGSSVLDDDFGSFGPIRRIRQKSNLLSPSKDVNSPLSEFKDVNKGSLYSQKPLQLDREQNEISNAGLLPAKSSETALKLLLQLEKLIPSPKEKSSEPETIYKDDSPSKLTLDMLHGSALRSMDDIDSSKLFLQHRSMQGSGKSDIASTSHTSNVEVSHPGNTDKVNENGPSKPAVSDVKLASEANGLTSAPVTPKDIKRVSVPERPAFRISAPEDSLDLDDEDDEDNTGGISVPSTAGNDGTEAKRHKDKNVISETKTTEKPLMSSSQSMPVSSATSCREDDNRAPAEPVVSKKESNFVFPLSGDTSQSQPPPIPTMPTPQLARPDRQNVQTSPAFNYAAKDASSPTFSSTAISVNDTVATKAREGSGSELNSSTSVSTASAEVSIVNKEDQTREAGNPSKPFGDTLFSGISKSSAPSVFAFAASGATNLSNGSLHSSSTTFSFSNSPTTTLSSGPMSFILSNDTSTPSSSSSTFVSSAAPVNSAFSPFRIGSSSASAPLDKSDASVLESKTVKASPYSISSVFPSTGSGSSSDIIASSTNISNGSLPSSISASVMTASTGSSSVLAPSALFSSTAGSSSPIASSATFPSTGSSGFGFNSSVQSNSSSQNSFASTFGASGGTSTSSPFFSNSSTQTSSASTIGATGGSIFDAQSTQSGSSNTSQSSTSQFGSFSSASLFGLGSSSSVSTGGSPFGSTSSAGGFSFSAGSGSSISTSSSSLAPVSTNGLFGSTSQASTSSIFSTASSGSSHTNSTSSLFGSSSQPSTSPFFPSSSGSSSQSTGFSFGMSSSAPTSGTSPFTFGSSSSSGSVFSFASAGPTASSISSPAPTFGFSSVSPGNNDQMSVEDTMTDDTNNQAAAAPFPAYGQPTNPTPTPSFVFGSPSGLPVFQFGGHQNPSVPQNPSPFQAAGNVEFTGGSFSLGSGGGEKSGRKMIKVRRKDPRKK